MGSWRSSQGTYEVLPVRGGGLLYCEAIATGGFLLGPLLLNRSTGWWEAEISIEDELQPDILPDASFAEPVGMFRMRLEATAGGQGGPTSAVVQVLVGSEEDWERQEVVRAVREMPLTPPSPQMAPPRPRQGTTAEREECPPRPTASPLPRELSRGEESLKASPAALAAWLRADASKLLVRQRVLRHVARLGQEMEGLLLSLDDVEVAITEVGCDAADSGTEPSCSLANKDEVAHARVAAVKEEREEFRGEQTFAPAVGIFGWRDMGISGEGVYQ